MKAKERVIFALMIWLAVYPSVLGATWVLTQLDLDLPLPVRVLLTTALTVPLLEFVVVPRLKSVVAKAERTLGVDGDLRDD